MGCTHQMLTGFCNVAIALKNERDLQVKCRWAEFKQTMNGEVGRKSEKSMSFYRKIEFMTLIKHSVAKNKYILL